MAEAWWHSTFPGKDKVPVADFIKAFRAVQKYGSDRLLSNVVKYVICEDAKSATVDLANLVVFCRMY
jgi:hypothetical protein